MAERWGGRGARSQKLHYWNIQKGLNDQLYKTWNIRILYILEIFTLEKGGRFEKELYEVSLVIHL